MLHKYELKPVTGQKSFYGKAVVICYSDGTKDLKSYNTIVCRVTSSGRFVRFWPDWSATTAKHINAFRMENGLHAIAKKEWLAIPVEPQNIVAEIIRLSA